MTATFRNGIDENVYVVSFCPFNYNRTWGVDA